MIVKVFSVFDTKAQFFGNPFYEQSESSAVRSFGDAVNRNEPNNMWFLHPEDYVLFFLGDFDNLSGSIVSSIPKSIVNASALSNSLIQKNINTPD